MNTCDNDSVIVPLSVRMTSFAHDASVSTDLIECHLTDEKLLFQGRPIRIVIHTSHEITEADIQGLFMRGDISLQSVDNRTSVGFDIRTKLDAEDISLRLWTGRITSDLINDIRTCMFYSWEDKQIYGVVKHTMPNIMTISFPTDKIIFYEGERYNMMEFVTSHIDCYNGIVNQEGPDIVVMGHKRYVNRRKLSNVTGIVDYALDHSNVVEAFVKEAGRNNIPGLIPDTKYTEYEMYKLFSDFTTSNKVLQSPTKKPWRQEILSHIIDTSAKSKNPEEARSNIVPGRMVKATTSHPSPHICYYVFQKQIPDNIKIVKQKSTV